MRRMEAPGYVREHEVPYERMREVVKNKGFRVELPTERHIALEMGVLDPGLETLLARKWMILLAPEGSPGFVTCDNPVCLMFSKPEMRGGFYRPGHVMAGTQVIFPVGRRMAIVGAFEFKEATLTINDDGVAGVNGALVAYAQRQVYAADPRFTYSRRDNERPRLGASLVHDAPFLKKPNGSEPAD